MQIFLFGWTSQRTVSGSGGKKLPFIRKLTNLHIQSRTGVESLPPTLCMLKRGQGCSPIQFAEKLPGDDVMRAGVHVTQNAGERFSVYHVLNK